MRAKWIELEEFPNYAVSNKGELVNLRTDHIKQPSRNQQGIAMVNLIDRDGRQKMRAVSVLVAEAFVEGRTDLFNTPIHLNGDRMDCSADNLMWRPRWFAIKYHKQFFTPFFQNSTPHLLLLNTNEYFSNVKDPAIKYGLIGMDIWITADRGENVYPGNLTFRNVNTPYVDTHY